MMVEKLLLHTCCAHCAAYTINHWQSKDFEVNLIWYNPNIHPFGEHQKRLETVRKFATDENILLIEIPGYDIMEYFRKVTNHGDKRCYLCFKLRLGKVILYALEHNYSFFSSTLLISPHQQHQLIKRVGEELSHEYSKIFLYSDLRKHYSDSRCITKPRNLYKQRYCGCLHSEFERYGTEIN